MVQEIDTRLMVFESDPDFSDNSRGLWDYVNKNTDYKTFWVVYDHRMLSILKSNHVDCALAYSEEADEMIAKAQYLITSSLAFANEKHAGQIHVSLWHGFPLKLIGFFDSAARNSNYLANLKFVTIPTDMISVTSRFSRLTVSGMFAVDPRKVKETGYPRNDIMLTSNAKEELRKLADIDNSRLFFYLPTMRKGLKDEGEQFEENIFNYQDYDVERLDSFLEEHNSYIFAKVHFADNALYEKDNFKIPKRMIFLDNYDLTKHLLTIYHIMDAFDALITDYSSVYADFLLLDKPIIFSCPDLQKYQRDRGFVVDDPKLLMPGAICQSQSQLLENLYEIINGRDPYQHVRKEKMSFFHLYQDGVSARRVLDEMEHIFAEGEVDASKEIAPYYLSASSPLFSYTRRAKAEIFLDYGDGFSEGNKLVRSFEVFGEGKRVEFIIDITAEMKCLRFDPENTGRWILKNFSVTVDQETMSVTPVNYFISGDYLIPANWDPQILIDLSDKSSGKMVVKYECLDILTDAGQIIKNMNEELSAIKRSYSWKISRPLRFLEKTLKPVLKKILICVRK